MAVRKLLACAAASAALAAASAAAAPSRPLDNIDHIVVFMQENRAYDHYYGTASGVRGFNDRAVHPLPSGLPAFYQPSDVHNASAYLLPFHVDTLTTSAICMDAPTMDYVHDMLILNGGRMDAWNTARVPGMGMSYFNRTDLPFYYTLIDNFAVGDQYFQSTYTCTNPNRMHLFTGSNGLSVGHFPVLDNTEPSEGYPWETMGEVLEAAGVSWKVLQEEDNFDDNGFAWFTPFKQAKPGNPLWDKGLATVPDIETAFDQLLANGSLPQVTWIVGPANQSEHATYHPCAGEDLSARLLSRLSAHPDVYAKTAFILNYDEGGQFVDHHWTPNAPLFPGDGVSSVNTTGESNLGMPVGPGFRVPLVIISPWTRGKIVVSQTFDHTSVIRLIEERFGVHCPNISPWRRGVLGDLTTAFDFDHPDYSWPVLPNTSAYVAQGNEECAKLPPPTLPAEQSYPVQEPGTRISRALPYAFYVSDSVNASALTFSITSSGGSGAAFIAFDLPNLAAVAPRKYGVANGTTVSDSLPINATTGSGYYFALHGPNGFVRTFAGDTAASNGLGLQVSAWMEYAPASTSVIIYLTNNAASDVTFTVTDHAYGLGGPWTYTLPAGTVKQAHTWNVGASGNWYDFSVDAALASRATSSALASSGAAGTIPFSRRFMGRMETGSDTISDPAMAAGVPGYVPIPHSAKSEKEWTEAVRRHRSLGGRLDYSLSFADSQGEGEGLQHPPVPDKYRFFPRIFDGEHKDAQYVWVPPHFEGQQ